MTLENFGFMLLGCYLGGMVCLLWVLLEGDGAEWSDIESLSLPFMVWPLVFVYRLVCVIYRAAYTNVVRPIRDARRKKDTDVETEGR